MTSSLTLKFLGRDEVLFMLKKIAENYENDNFFDEIFELNHSAFLTEAKIALAQE